MPPPETAAAPRETEHRSVRYDRADRGCFQQQPVILRLLTALGVVSLVA
jgi:hypothetical protein